MLNRTSAGTAIVVVVIIIIINIIIIIHLLRQLAASHTQKHNADIQGGPKM